MTEAETWTIALAGNPNVGKSTLFNALTGLRQHTGNWPGKTVAVAEGSCRWQDRQLRLVDLPGTYSLRGDSPEETLSADFLSSGEADCVVAVLDATCLERSLRLCLEILDRTDRVVVCLNLMDEALRAGSSPDPEILSRALGVPVVPARRDRPKMLRALLATAALVCAGGTEPGPVPRPGDAVAFCADLACAACPGGNRPRAEGVDWLLLGKYTAYPALLLLLFGLLWLTLEGANLPSALLQQGFDRLGTALGGWLDGWPRWLRGALLDGVYATTARVIAVMLPPMAIFFPLFTLLEDLGYLPRAAFLLDRPYACAGSCGKQALTACMGLGCNAVGVTGCRILGSRRQRLAAVVTNSMIPCNGRFPTLVVLLSFFPLGTSAAGRAAALLGLLAVALGMSLAVTRVLTWLLGREEQAHFFLELPPYRRPQVGRLLVRSVLDRTLRVLGRAAAVAAPAGLVIWLLTVLRSGDRSLLQWLRLGLEPLGGALGMSGALLLAFLLGWPANELVLPLWVLIIGAGTGLADWGAQTLTALLRQQGMDWRMALCTAVFCLFHWPCSTTVLTVRRETGSLKWTLLSVIIPTAVGAGLCAMLHLVLGRLG